MTRATIDPAPFRQPIAAVSPTEQLLLALLVEMRGLRADLARGGDRRPAALSRDDRRHQARLLPAIGGACGSELFVVHELFESDSAALRVTLRGLNAMQVGRLLRRAVGVPIEGLLVEREATEAGVVVWRVVQVSGVEGNERVFVPSAPREGRKE